ncbi:hypothetical protein E3U43_017087 [Larimichthys crocea]|uniref:Uncharacterized protein n=1 Tax=Larimichthys crocea TaxID=215358 RepID=A0ACD3QZ33_LARCR|nr:hypothetical protein E3U43_017087 [Larimichthys crocea]
MPKYSLEGGERSVTDSFHRDTNVKGGGEESRRTEETDYDVETSEPKPGAWISSKSRGFPPQTCMHFSVLPPDACPPPPPSLLYSTGRQTTNHDSVCLTHTHTLQCIQTFLYQLIMSLCATLC